MPSVAGIIHGGSRASGNSILSNSADQVSATVGELGNFFSSPFRGAFDGLFGLNSAYNVSSSPVTEVPSVDSSSSNLTDPYDYAKYILGLEQEAADKQYLNELNSANIAMNFESSEAEKLRNWQTQMRNTAYQASVADLKKAGLNPILAIGSPAAVPSGGMGSGHVANSAKANMNVGSNVALALRELAVNSATKLTTSTLKMIADIIPG